MGRFINADALVSTGQGVLGNNMFTYCVNNPVNMADPTGQCSYFLFFKLDCFSASCPTSQCYNPDAPNAVVIYDGRASGTPWWLGNNPGDDGFAHQGQELMRRLSGSYNVTGYAYTTMDEFINVWNSLDESYDAIYILGHGQPGKFNAIGGSLRSCGSDYSYSDLANVDVAVIYLYMCNGATLTDGYTSTADNFANLTGANVHAVSNGKLNFTWYNCFPYISPRYWLTGQWTATSLD